MCHSKAAINQTIVEDLRVNRLHKAVPTYLPTYLLTYLITSWSRDLLEKLTGLQLVKNFPAFYGT